MFLERVELLLELIAKLEVLLEIGLPIVLEILMKALGGRLDALDERQDHLIPIPPRVACSSRRSNYAFSRRAIFFLAPPLFVAPA